MRFWKKASPPPFSRVEHDARVHALRPALERRRPPVERAHDAVLHGEVVLDDIELRDGRAVCARSPGRSLGRGVSSASLTALTPATRNPHVGVGQDRPAVAVLVLGGLDRGAGLLTGRAQHLLGVAQDLPRSRRWRAAGRRSPPRSRWRRPSSVSSVTWAVVIANSRSVGGRLQLAPAAEERVEEAHAPAVVPWSCASSCCEAAMRFSIGGCVENSAKTDCLDAGRDDEERVHAALGLAQVALGIRSICAGDLHERRGQRAGRR